MAHNSKVVKLPSKNRCNMRQLSCLSCVDTSFTSLEMVIWLVDMNFHTSHIQDYVCNHW